MTEERSDQTIYWRPIAGGPWHGPFGCKRWAARDAWLKGGMFPRNEFQFQFWDGTDPEPPDPSAFPEVTE